MEQQALLSAYEIVQNSKFYVGFIGTIFGVSTMIFLRLWLILFGVYSMVAVPSVATVELFLFGGHLCEVALIFRSLLESHVSLTPLFKIPFFAADLLLVIFGLVFLILQFLTSAVGLTFFVNFVWMGGMTARGGWYFRSAWVRATSQPLPQTPTEQTAPVIMMEGKAVGGPISRV